MNLPPFMNSNYNYDDDDEWVDDIRGRSAKEMVALFMEDMLNKEQGKVAPNTTGADYFFLKEFITDDMEFDFALIEQEFLKHCNGKLQEFNEVGWYGIDEWWTATPKEALQQKLLRLMYNGAKLGDEYCVELIKYLYKIYHKREYKQLKRFSKITPSEIFSLAENEDRECSYTALGRILGMCQFMGIKLDASCSILFLLLDKERKDWIGDDEADRDLELFDQDLFNECINQVELWTRQEDETDYASFRRASKVYWEQDEFVGACLKHLGYPSDYAYRCMENNMGLRMQMARALAVLKTANPKKEYSFEEVQRYTALYSTVASLVDIANHFDIELGYLIGDKVDEFDSEETLFHPEAINYQPKKEKKEPAAKPIVNVAPVSNGTASEEDYLKEIAELRSKLNAKELESRSLREQYLQLKKQKDEVLHIIDKYEAERDELIALREFAYHSKLGEEAISEETYLDRKEAVAEKNIVIIGGHINWINKLKNQFPNWLFVHQDSFKTVDGKMLENKDHVYFFTDYMNHASYYKFIAAVRERDIPFGYLGSINVENIVNQIYRDLDL